MASGDSLTRLTEFIRRGLPAEGDARALLEALFDDRYQKADLKDSRQVRDALALAVTEDRGVPFAGFVHPESAPSGAYGGMSVVWFPTEAGGSLLTLVVGTSGLSPDEGILTRPGHARRVAALRRLLTARGMAAWTKSDPSNLNLPVPEAVRQQFRGFQAAFRRYSPLIYAAAAVPQDDPTRARAAVQAFFDLYAYEREWRVRAKFEHEWRWLAEELHRELFPPVSAGAVNDLLRLRRFVVLQGPPGTGKTRLAEEVKKSFFRGRGETIQFHPAVTYEDFIAGIAPDTVRESLVFHVQAGALVRTNRAAEAGPYLLVIDEINRADLGRVLGEAIYTFEAREVGSSSPRRVRLPHSVDGQEEFEIHPNLYVLGTMNTADRSIAGMDLAVRRRFAFITVPPDIRVVESQANQFGEQVFRKLMSAFVEHAPEETLNLLPGHAYFLAGDDAELRDRLRFELIPLLEEYLRTGLAGPLSSELQAIRDEILDHVEQG